MTAPRVERIAFKDGYKYQLVESYAVDIHLIPAARIETRWVTLDLDGVLTIREGYAWDGPSGPTCDTASSLRPSLVHDAAYQLIGLRLLPEACRAHADRLFLDLCAEDGMGWARRTIWHRMVRWFGPRHGSAEKPVRYAPTQG